MCYMHLFVQSDSILLSTSSRSIDECVALLLVILHGRLIDSTWRVVLNASKQKMQGSRNHVFKHTVKIAEQIAVINLLQKWTGITYLV